MRFQGAPFFAFNRGDLGRTPNITQTDLNLQHDFRIGNFALQLGAIVLNLFDQKEVTNIYPVYSTSSIRLRDLSRCGADLSVAGCGPSANTPLIGGSTVNPAQSAAFFTGVDALRQAERQRHLGAYTLDRRYMPIRIRARSVSSPNSSSRSPIEYLRVGLRPHPFFMRPLFFAALVAVLAGCASQQSLKPTVTIAQTSAVEPLRVSPQSGVPVEYRLDVTNPLDHSVTLTAVEIETVGLSGGYTMKRVRHTFAQVIPPHTSATIALRAWVQPLQESESGQVVSPVMLRGIAKFESMGSTLQSAFTGRVR